MRYQFGGPISGQLEVCAKHSSTDNEKWIAEQGIYISSE
jgi:hypothetical protein